MSGEELEKKIAALPKGYISKKNINGKVCHYRQWKENGKVKSEYISDMDVDFVAALISERKRLSEELKLEIYREDTSLKGIHRFCEYIRKFYLGRNVPIGIQDYEFLIVNKLFYVDKTIFIRDWWNNGDQVSLITRPRRFGKTLTLSMVNCFFSKEYSNRKDLFEGLGIWQYPEMRKLQGSFPVIFISFGNIKYSDVSRQTELIKTMIQSIFSSFSYIKENLSDEDAAIFQKYFENMSNEMAINGLHVLCELIYKSSGQKTIILLDEYDTPLLEAWSFGTYDECACLMRMFFNSTFKTNRYLYRGILTGITQISKESFFSDLNNLKVFSMLSDTYSTAFGFTEKEVFAAMDEQKLTDKEGVKSWFDGFTIGKCTDIYNPWSIVNYLRDKKLKPYWVNSGSNKMISDIFKGGSAKLKTALENLLKGKSIFTRMNMETTLKSVYYDDTAFWSLLVANGYLKIISAHGDEWDLIYELAPTNKEVLFMLSSFVKEWFADSRIKYNDFITALLQNDIYYMNEYMNAITHRIFSYFDVSGNNEPERFYHGFILGLMVNLENEFYISSNRESGLGRYDVILEPKNPLKNHAIVMEFKVFRKGKDASMESAAAEALAQIDKKQYITALTERGISRDNIYCYGLVFDGKEVVIEGA